MERLLIPRIEFNLSISLEPSNSNKSGKIAWMKKYKEALNAIKEKNIASKKCCQ